jgi:glutamate/tyrosine decarboxylase-like PLP-dependent enzyme
MEDEALRLLAESANKNIIDHEEYPKSVEIEHRCLNILADLFHSPISNGTPTAVGTACIGSSEAIMLAVLAMKKRWQNNRRAQGKEFSKPNIVMSTGVQLCWEKASKYFDLDEKLVPCTETRYVIDPIQAVDLVDENTVGICVILGTTYTGQYEDVQAINNLLVQRGLETPIHVDAASGGFVAPFVNPELQWDFQLSNVVSINVSGHKYGLVNRISSLRSFSQLTILPGIPRHRLGPLALPSLPPRRSHLQHQLPRRGPAKLHPEFLQTSLTHHSPILPTNPTRSKRIHSNHDQPHQDSRPPNNPAKRSRLHHHE